MQNRPQMRTGRKSIYTEEERREARRAAVRKFAAKNREKLRALARQRYHANPQKEKDRHKRWVEKNKKHLREYGRNRYKINPIPKIMLARKYRADHPDYSAVACKKYAKKNRPRLRILAAAAFARRRKADGSFSPADIFEIMRLQKNKCGYCRKILPEKNVHVDHIIPIARGGTNYRQNLQLLCATCNKSKGPKDPIEFARYTGRLI